MPPIFPAGGDGETVPLPDGDVRSYHRGEVKAYAYDSGKVYSKYDRAMNSVLLGKSQHLLAGRFAAGLRQGAWPYGAAVTPLHRTLLAPDMHSVMLWPCT